MTSQDCRANQPPVGRSKRTKSAHYVQSAKRRLKQPTASEIVLPGRGRLLRESTTACQNNLNDIARLSCKPTARRQVQTYQVSALCAVSQTTTQATNCERNRFARKREAAARVHDSVPKQSK